MVVTSATKYRRVEGHPHEKQSIFSDACQLCRFVKGDAWSCGSVRDGRDRCGQVRVSGGDSLGLRIAQPLRVASGGISLNLPTAYSYATEAATYELVPLSLAPRGRELDTELAWRGALWGGNASASVFARFNPGNVASLPLDKGVAVRWNTGF